MITKQVKVLGKGSANPDNEFDSWTHILERGLNLESRLLTSKCTPSHTHTPRHTYERAHTHEHSQAHIHMHRESINK